MPQAALIPTSPLPDKDPPESLRTLSISPSKRERTTLTASKIMPPPPRPTLSTQTTDAFVPASQIPTPRQEIEGVGEVEDGHAGEARPRPAFSPFFTLVHDSTTQSTHHPSRIHYLFSDDDASEVLTASLLKSLQQNNSSTPSPSASREELEQSEDRIQSVTSSSSSATFKSPSKPRNTRKSSGKKPEREKEREERVVIVDVNENEDGTLGVAGVSSLSESWQVLSANIDNAPTWDGADTESSQPDPTSGLMLRIEGIGTSFGDEGREGLGITADKVKVGKTGKGESMGDSGVGAMGDDEMRELLEGFDKKMGVLRRIVQSGELRERDVGGLHRYELHQQHGKERIEAQVEARADEGEGIGAG